MHLGLTSGSESLLFFGLGHGMRFIVSLPLRFQGNLDHQARWAPRASLVSVWDQGFFFLCSVPGLERGRALLSCCSATVCGCAPTEGWKAGKSGKDNEKGLGTLPSGDLQASPWRYSDLTANIQSFHGAGDPANLLWCQGGEAAFPRARNLEPGGTGLLVDH